jgi:peptide deformylase
MAGHDHDHGDDHAHAHGDEQEHEAADTAERDAERLVRKRIALAQVRQFGDPVLRMRAGEVETFDEELARLAERMTALMHDADGIGLAATQVGVLRRLFVFSVDGEDRVLVNPVITDVGGEPEVDDEGCLSLGTVRVPVERQLAVTIEGKDAAGNDVRLELEGMPARVVQHELDQLDGVLIIDRTDQLSRKDAMAQLRPRLLIGSR